MQRHTDQLPNVKVIRSNVVLALIGSIIVASSFVIFAPVEIKTLQGGKEEAY